MCIKYLCTNVYVNQESIFSNWLYLIVEREKTNYGSRVLTIKRWYVRWFLNDGDSVNHQPQMIMAINNNNKYFLYIILIKIIFNFNRNNIY